MARILTVCLLALAPSLASAQAIPCGGTTEAPCTYAIDELQLQRGPTVFRFQAKISQSKLPDGKGVFQAILVNLLRGTEVLCRESIPKVEVTGGVLNLDIGRGMDCALEEVIAENTALAFQICLGGPSSCLPPVRLGSVPYAVKTTFAAVVQDAKRAQHAARSEWAHRLTADAQLSARKSIGTGYFDFYTHPAEHAVALYDAGDYVPVSKAGFVQWAAVTPAGRSLHLVGREHATGALRNLTSIALKTPEVRTWGALLLTPKAPGLTLSVTGPATIAGDSGSATLALRGALTVSAGGLNVAQGGLALSGDASFAGGLVLTGGLTAPTGATVTGTSTVSGPLSVGSDIQVTGGGLEAPGASGIGGAMDVATTLTVGGALTVTGTARVTGVATFEQGFTTYNAADLRYLQFSGDTRPQAFTGAVDFKGGLVLQAGANLGGGAFVGGRFERAAAPPVPCDAAHLGYLYLDTAAAAVMVCAADTWKPLAMTVCGDGLVQLGEDCDDGDRDDGDGCAGTCLPEAGYTCTGEPSVCTP